MQISPSHSELEVLGGSVSILNFLLGAFFFGLFCFIHTGTSVMLIVPIENPNFPVVFQQITPPLLTTVRLLLQRVMVEAQEAVTQVEGDIFSMEGKGGELRMLFFIKISKPLLGPAFSPALG